MEFSIIQIADYCALFVDTLKDLMERFTTPLRYIIFDNYWIPDGSLLHKFLFGTIDVIIGPFLNFSILEILIGGGLIAYIVYQLVTWILNLVT